MGTGGEQKDPLIGAVIGKCKILAKLGQGGMGDVYLAQHQFLKKNIALKLLPSDFSRDDESVARFQREAISAAKLEHPNTVQIHDIGIDKGRHYIVMQYVEGRTLQDLIDDKKGPMEVKESGHIIRECAKGLKAAHDHGIVHRDIKPANILVSNAGEVKITDFGLAFDQGVAGQMTQAGVILGTPQFMSPEQADGKRGNEQSDIYSLGVIFYYLVTGKKPFEAQSQMATLYKQINEKPQPIRDLNPHVPPAVVSIIQKMMAKKPSARQQIAEELIQEIDRVIAHSSGHKVSVPPRRRSSQIAQNPRTRHARSRSEMRNSSSSSQIVFRQRSPIIALVWLGALIAVLGTIIVVILLTQDTEPKNPLSPPPSEEAKQATPYTRLLSKGNRQFKNKDFVNALASYKSALDEKNTPEVRNKIQLTKMRIAAAEERILWRETLKEDSIKAFDRYLEKFPSGEHSELAWKKRAALQKKESGIPEDSGFTLLLPDAENKNHEITSCTCLGTSALSWRGTSATIDYNPPSTEDQTKYHFFWTERTDIADAILKVEIYIDKGGPELFCRFPPTDQMEENRTKYFRWPPGFFPQSKWVTLIYKVQGDFMELWIDDQSQGKKFIPSDVSRFGRFGLRFRGKARFQLRGMKIKVLRTIDLGRIETPQKRLKRKQEEAKTLLQSGKWEKAKELLLSVINDPNVTGALLNQACNDLFSIAQQKEWTSSDKAFTEWNPEGETTKKNGNRIKTKPDIVFSPEEVQKARGLSMRFKVNEIGEKGAIGLEVWNVLEKRPIRFFLSDQKIWLHPLNKGQLDHLPAKINYIENGTTIHVIQFKGTFVFYLGGNSIWKIRAGDYEFRQNSGFYFRDVDAEVESIKVLR
ncbi:MAG: serine/threonine-protein kinase [Planctomycetota bacterium]|nr:serine/threonine-protein kinase [Planctomycetota bacterium]